MNNSREKVKEMVIRLRNEQGLSTREINTALNKKGIKIDKITVWNMYQEYLDTVIDKYLREGGGKA